jgi:hypothetical protein
MVNGWHEWYYSINTTHTHSQRKFKHAKEISTHNGETTYICTTDEDIYNSATVNQNSGALHKVHLVNEAGNN